MDAPRHGEPGEAPDAQLAYVVIRVRRHSSGGMPRLTGVAEHLGTAEKKPFGDGDALLRLIEEWATGLPKI
jgi:hypothetical protein